jgi:hypothetical protein
VDQCEHDIAVLVGNPELFVHQPVVVGGAAVVALCGDLGATAIVSSTKTGRTNRIRS